MKRVNNSDINIRISPKIVNVTDCNLKFYTVNAENFYILKTNEDITTVERECNGHTFNEYYIKLLWSELITLGEGVLQFIVLNSSKHVERTTEYYIDSNVTVDPEHSESWSELLSEIDTKLDEEITRSTSADTALEEGKQDTLVSGTNIKTINNESILGSGNIDIQGADLSNYYTKSQTSGATEISTALANKADTTTTYTKTEVDNAITSATSTKQDTLVSGTNIKTINNESILGSGNINIQGGGKAIAQGRGITITTGATADTVSFNLPISGGSGNYSIIEGEDTTASGEYSHAEGGATIASGDWSHAEGASTIASGDFSHAEGFGTTASTDSSHAEGNNTTANGDSSHAEGGFTTANGWYSHSEGYYTTANGDYSHAEGRDTIASNKNEHASGQYNVSNKASTTFGNSGNTLFSVGNGTSDSAKHNAFEIRQNGDIYITLNGQDVKLQDNLGGGGSSSVTVDSVISSTSTNPLENRAIYNQFDGLKLQIITLSAYNALQNKDNNTLYIIEE